MAKKLSFILLIMGVCILSITQHVFSASDKQRTRTDKYDPQHVPRTHAEDHTPQAHGLTGAEGGYGEGGGGVDGYIIGGTIEEREQKRKQNAKKGPAKNAERQQTRARVIKKADVDRVIGRWEERPREVAREMINKYGLPNEATQNRLTWHDNDPWARTEVLSEEYDHRFPENHTDVLIQTVNYEVPADKVDDLIQFHGGLVVKRTKGTLSVLCGNEEMNILALNLADDIIADKLTVEEARDVYAEQATAVMKGEPAPLTEELQFEPSMEATDPDQPAEKGFIERAREVLGLD
jgi:hypothetical protein